MRVSLLTKLIGLSLIACVCEATPFPEQKQSEVQAVGPRKLRGRFLHITDPHPDPFYKTYSSTEQDDACHRGTGPAGFYGAETSACDSPISLVNETFRWIEHNLKDEIDFVVWTGDSARHDNDESIPRTEHQILDQNGFLVSKFLEVFGKPENYNDSDPTNDFIIPIIPTVGNNDIMPHNIFESGPNWWTKRYLHLWRQFIPEEQRHQFEHGGWFYVEVIPNKLAVFSLNTMYFYINNAAVDGCSAKSEPGYDHMEWLRVQLQFMREKGMKALITGHVPPARTESKNSWDETCWQKYTLWLRQYRDVIVGSLYGHMNIDHFMLQDFEDIDWKVAAGVAETRTIRKRPHAERPHADGAVAISSAGEYLMSLRDDWSKLPDPPRSEGRAAKLSGDGWTNGLFSLLESLRKDSHSKHSKHSKQGKNRRKYLDKIGGEWAERYSMSHVSASVVPNYFPALRVFHYNITGLEDLGPASPDVFSSRAANQQIQLQELPDRDKVGQERHKKKGHKGPGFSVPDPPAKTAPPGPAYSPQTLSLLSFTQYFANLTHINNDFNPEEPRFDPDSDGEPLEQNKWKEGKHHGKRPKKGSRPRPKKFEYQVEYDTRSDELFALPDLTVRSYLDLARRIGSFKSTAEMAPPDGKKEDMDTSEKWPSGLPETSDRDDSASRPEAVEHGSSHEEKKHGKHKKANVWLKFVERAFVGSMDLDDIREQFGDSDGDS